jgi:hypothetical protein
LAAYSSLTTNDNQLPESLRRIRQLEAPGGVNGCPGGCDAENGALPPNPNSAIPLLRPGSSGSIARVFEALQTPQKRVFRDSRSAPEHFLNDAVK